MPFRDREEAARLLARNLRAYKGQDPLILAIPRGALPMGKILAEELDGELDIVLVRKLGAPGNPELAIGAVSETGDIVLGKDLGYLGVPESWIEEERERQLQLLKERRERYTPDRSPADPAGRVVIVVDDGIATGATFKAALKVVRARQPRRLVAAFAVAPRSSLLEIAALADEVACLETPPFFLAVGQFFEDFRQVTDEEVVGILRAARREPVEP